MTKVSRAGAHDWAAPVDDAFVLPYRKLGKPVFRAVFGLHALGVNKLPARGAVILAANHPSYLDPLFIGACLPRGIRTMTWEKVLGVPVIGTWSRRAGAFPVPIGEPGAGARAALRTSLAVLGNGEMLLVFPEGQRSHADGTLRPFRSGIGYLAAQAGLPIHPVAVLGSWRVWPTSFRRPRLAPVRIEILPPITLDPKERAAGHEERSTHEALAQRTQAAIVARVTVAQTRGLAASRPRSD